MMDVSSDLDVSQDNLRDKKKTKRGCEKKILNGTFDQDNIDEETSYLQPSTCVINSSRVHDKANYKSKKLKSPVMLSNTGGLSHFMELEARTDLLCNSPMADPLGPDSFDNIQWVDVKQEFPDEIEASKVTLTELPLQVEEQSLENFNPVASFNHAKEPVRSKMQDNLPYDLDCGISEAIQHEDMEDSCGSSDQNYLLDENWSELKEGEKNQEPSLKKRRKSIPKTCDICGKRLSSIGSLRLHKLKKHKLKIQFTCELCGLKFDFQREVVHHRNSTHRQTDGRFPCDICNKRFLDYHSFLLHMKTHINNCKEEEGSENACKECEKSFQDDESLRIHKILMHRVELREKLKNQEKNFICHTCGKRFAFSCLLRDHINLHTGTKPYLCQKCGKAFAQKASLKQHTKTHNDIRPFQCSECPQGFYGKGDFKKHLRKHTGERPYVCEVCGDGFSRSTHLSVHRRTHTGERPHSCDICGRGFTKRGDLVRHRRVHTGELPYLCQVCGKAFRQSTQCANHIKSQHPDSSVAIAKNPNPLDHKLRTQIFC